MHDREYIDAAEGVRDPFKRVVRILNETHDQDIVRKYGIWVVRHDPTAGLKVHGTWYMLLYLADAQPADIHIPSGVETRRRGSVE